jgi:hypothetical protein
MTEPMVISEIETTKDLGKSPQSIVRQWKLEIGLANNREEKWREIAAKIYKQYTPTTPAANSFNILWTNTETLRQSVYNSLPEPQVKRRYSDNDPLGKAVSGVLTRALEFSQDTYDFDAVLKGDVLAMLLAGRSVSRVRYMPKFRTVEGGKPENTELSGDTQDDDSYEEIDWEQVVCERVQWDDFRILCAAKTWDEVYAIAFRHRLTRAECVEKFGEEIGNGVPMDDTNVESVNKSKEESDLFKTAEVWEIWDKDEKKVHFISLGYPTPLKTQDDPLELQGFFPVPRPLYAIENDQSLIPAALYTQYEQQAKELNKISQRINKLVDSLRVRGIYDSTMSELSQLMKMADGELVPAQNATAWSERGGIGNAIWMMPIDAAANVLRELYVQREATKKIIFEITGISDIMRSATDAGETLGAQQLKTQWGTQRLQRMQKEVQRYIRDLIRLKAEVISEKFQMETLEGMTLVNLPHQAQVDAQYQQAMLQYQQQAMQPPQQGQPPAQPPQPPQVITWEKTIDAMREDATRTYHIDIETDSTLTASQNIDMNALKDLLGGITAFMTGVAPTVQAGALPIEAVKEVVMTVIRRAKMGSAVEDAFEQMKEPTPPADPNAGQAQIEQAKMQMQQQMQQQEHHNAMQLQQTQAQLDAQVEQSKQAAQAQQNEHQNALEAQRAQMQIQYDAQLEQLRTESDARVEQMKNDRDWMIAQMNNQTKVQVAEIAAGVAIDTAQIQAANQSIQGGENV